MVKSECRTSVRIRACVCGHQASSTRRTIFLLGNMNNFSEKVSFTWSPTSFVATTNSPVRAGDAAVFGAAAPRPGARAHTPGRVAGRHQHPVERTPEAP